MDIVHWLKYQNWLILSNTNNIIIIIIIIFYIFFSPNISYLQIE